MTPPPDSANPPRIVPVLLAGGSGTRLWPLSRADRPKQFISFGGQPSLFHQTIARIAGNADTLEVSRIAIVGAADHAALIEREIAAFPDMAFDLLYEPCPRNTAAAIGAALHHVSDRMGDACLAILPCDHHIGDEQAFRDDLAFAATCTHGGSVVTLGIVPDSPHTGYGYIRAAGAQGRARDIAQFIEKPDAAMAEKLIAGGDCLWNAGMFVMQAQAGLAEFSRQAPEIAEKTRQAVSKAQAHSGGFLLEETAFAACESLPFDIAVMEKTGSARVVTASFSWSDLGEWPAIATHFASNSGELVTSGANNIHLEGGGRLVAVAGVDDLIIVDTPDALLITSAKPGADVKAIVEKVREANPELLKRSPPPAETGKKD